ncbi:hypothetical protein J6W34_06225 [bacterium]|nr:hypothetical protein [bacterium]
MNILIDFINKKYEKYQYVLIIQVGGCDDIIRIADIFEKNDEFNYFIILDLDDKNKKNNGDKLKKENFNEDKYFLVKSDIED